MENKLKVEITGEHDDKRVINYLKFELKMSSRLTRKLLSGGFVTLNGHPARGKDVLKQGDILEVHLDTGDTQNIEPEDIPVGVVYEDQDLLIVNKPPFMVVHPTKSYPSGTLANAVMNYFKNTGQNCIVRLVSRLDRDTSGLVTIAKSQFAHQAMAKKMEGNEIDKYYITVVEGRMEGEGTIDLPIDRPSMDSIKRMVMEGGQRAVTHYKVLKSSDEMSCLLIRLETGKTHQIRVHLSHLGHPIVGDSLYGRESSYISRQALHAYKLRFNCIRSGEKIEVEAEIPDDMKRLIELIEK